MNQDMSQKLDRDKLYQKPKQILLQRIGKKKKKSLEKVSCGFSMKTDTLPFMDQRETQKKKQKLKREQK